MEQKNLEELYHKGELEWEEGEYTVCRGFQWTPPGCHNSCGILYYLKDGVMDHAEGDPLFPYNKGRLCARCLNLHEAGYQENRLKYPLLRKKEDRGNIDAFKRVSWDEALDYIANYVKNEIDGKGYAASRSSAWWARAATSAGRCPGSSTTRSDPRTRSARCSPATPALFRARPQPWPSWAVTRFPTWGNSTSR